MANQAYRLPAYGLARIRWVSVNIVSNDELVSARLPTICLFPLYRLGLAKYKHRDEKTVPAIFAYVSGLRAWREKIS